MDRFRFGRGPSAALLLTLLHAGAWAAASQEPTVVLRGTVADSAGTPVPHALVRVLPGAAEQFTTPRGSFGAAGLVPGTYRIGVRQVGFAAFDTAVAVPRGARRSASC